MTFTRSLKYLSLVSATYAVSLSGAMAVPFTWNPSAAVPGADGPFMASNITVQDYATINVASSGSFTENGLINLSTFTNSGTSVTLPNLDSTYTLYASFTATGTQAVGNVNPAPGTSIDGTFNSLDYTLFAAQGKPTFSASSGGTSVTGLTNEVTLATGNLISGAAALTRDPLAGLSATATTVNTFNPVDAAFFVSPPSTFALGLSVALTNTGSVLTTPSPSELVINGGGGNATLSATSTPVPEPASMALLGAGLVGLGLARRRKTN